ncbi:MAG TPA: glycosyltransferase, partial [Bdellovibrionota bacterium]|nr:glycosyltransferase [Bdellovibrionota bacterium]
GMRGGEYVLEAIAEMFPQAELFTLVHVPDSVTPPITSLKRHVSPLQRVPGIEKRYRHFLPVMPKLIERFDLSGFDLVVSSSHCVAKGVRKAPGAVHVTFVHAPMRYVWDRYDDYFGPGRASLPVRAAAFGVRGFLQRWDRESSSPQRIDAITCNSRFIAGRIREAWGREARVIYPFADLSRFTQPRKPGRNYVMVGAFAPYKRVDLAIEAFNRLKLPLLIVGSGQDEERARRAAGPTIEFLGSLSNSAIADLFAKGRAFIFPAKEDFGITPVEALAAGLPVIAFGEGGAAETVTPETGLHFRPQTVDALCEAVRKFESGAVEFSEDACRRRAANFTRQRFQHELMETIREVWTKAGKGQFTLRS